MTGDALEHPDLTGVAADMRADWRAETEAATEDAQAQWRHSRTLADWLIERVHAGDRIAVTIGDQRFAGFVEELGPDLIALRAVFGRVDIHLAHGVALSIEIVDHATSGGERAESNRTFRDVLIARDGQSNVSVGTVHDLEGLDGTLYVGADFVSVVAKLGAESVVPLRYVVWASARRT
jgi:hypothetical protein